MSCFGASTLIASLKSASLRTASLRTAILSALALGGLALTASGCSEAPADGDCEKLLVHLVAMEVNAGSATDAKKLEYKSTLADETRESFVERCNTKLKARQVTCSLQATTSEEVEACDS